MSVFNFSQGVINDVALAQGNNTPLSFAQAPVAFGGAALAMTKSIVNLSQSGVVYGIVVQNVGTTIATGVIVEDHAVSHVAFVMNPVSTTGATLIAFDQFTVRFAVGNMLPGQIAVIYVPGRIY